MDNSDDSIQLTLELGFHHDHHLTNSSESEKKKKKNGFSFLSLALSEPEPEPRSDDDDHATAVRDDNIIKELNKGKTVVAAASSVTAVTSWTAAMSDEDEDCNTPRKKLRLSKHQISLLENTFQIHPTLNPKDKNDLATQLNLRPRQVEVWFQNRRARIKMKQTEVDRESLKKCCEILREENRRLQKEVTELKSLKLQPSIPFQFQVNVQSSSSPAAPTMCPSCEGTGKTRSSSLNPNNHINGDAGSPTRSFFSSSTDSNNTPKTRVCEN